MNELNIKNSYELHGNIKDEFDKNRNETHLAREDVFMYLILSCMGVTQ